MELENPTILEIRMRLINQKLDSPRLPLFQKTKKQKFKKEVE